MAARDALTVWFVWKWICSIVVELPTSALWVGEGGYAKRGLKQRWREGVKTTFLWTSSCRWPLSYHHCSGTMAQLSGVVRFRNGLFCVTWNV